MMKKKINFAVLLLTITLLFLPVTASQADLTITPVRVVFQGRDRSATIMLLNVTDHTNTYRMGWLVMKPDATGKYVFTEADEKDPLSVDKMVVFSPRQVTIEPHAYQAIHLSLRRPSDLPPGEYRGHLVFKRLAKDAPQRKPDPEQKGKVIAMSVNLSFSIPVIVRSGDDRDLKISLSAPKLVMGGSSEKPTPQLNIDMVRDAGKFSSYGSVKVYLQPSKGEEREIGLLDNVALYPEVPTRNLKISLKENPTSGQVKVVYAGKYESEGKIWAEKTFPITQ